jgi:hypothetical protein
MANEHSDFFSPSSGGRLLTCPGSAKASAGIPDQQTLFSSEGTDAHTLAEIRLKAVLGMECDSKVEDLKWYSKEMEDYIADYVSYVLEKIEEAKKICKDPVVLVEQKVSAKKYDDNLYGTTDVAIIADNHLTIIDLKYGKGVQVFAKENVQEMIYGICCLETFGDLYDIDEVTLCIFQPRLNSVSEWTVTVDELYKWAEEVLKTGIQKLRDGVEEFNPSKYCVFCKAKPLCKALRDKNLELAKYEFRPPFLMDDDEIEEVLDKADEFTNWINSVREFAVDEAIHGKRYKNWKLVEGRSVRKYSDEKAVAERVKKAGYEPYEEKLLNITAMTSMLGKAKFNELLSDLLVKPRGKLTLATKDDKRPEVSSAEVDFSDKENN